MSVVYLNTCDGNKLRDIADMIDADKVTHAAVVYRSEDGDVCYRLVGAEDGTYLIGMLERAQMHMHCSDAYVLPDPE